MRAPAGASACLWSLRILVRVFKGIVSTRLYAYPEPKSWSFVARRHKNKRTGSCTLFDADSNLHVPAGLRWLLPGTESTLGCGRVRVARHGLVCCTRGLRAGPLTAACLQNRTAARPQLVGRLCGTTGAVLCCALCWPARGNAWHTTRVEKESKSACFAAKNSSFLLIFSSLGGGGGARGARLLPQCQGLLGARVLPQHPRSVPGRWSVARRPARTCPAPRHSPDNLERPAPSSHRRCLPPAVSGAPMSSSADSLVGLQPMAAP